MSYILTQLEEIDHVLIEMAVNEINVDTPIQADLFFTDSKTWGVSSVSAYRAGKMNLRFSENL